MNVDCGVTCGLCWNIPIQHLSLNKPFVSIFNLFSDLAVWKYDLSDFEMKQWTFSHTTTAGHWVALSELQGNIFLAPIRSLFLQLFQLLYFFFFGSRSSWMQRCVFQIISFCSFYCCWGPIWGGRAVTWPWTYSSKFTLCCNVKSYMWISAIRVVHKCWSWING